MLLAASLYLLPCCPITRNYFVPWYPPASTTTFGCALSCCCHSQQSHLRVPNRSVLQSPPSRQETLSPCCRRRAASVSLHHALADPCPCTFTAHRWTSLPQAPLGVCGTVQKGTTVELHVKLCHCHFAAPTLLSGTVAVHSVLARSPTPETS